MPAVLFQIADLFVKIIPDEHNDDPPDQSAPHSQHDVQTVFLYGVLPPGQCVYLSVTEGLDLPVNKLLLCVKGIYGLKQAPHLFNQHLTSAISSLGYTRSKSDPCVVFKQKGHYLYLVYRR